MALNDMAKRKSRDIKYENNFFDEKFMCSRDQIPISKLQLYKISKTTSMGRSEIFLVKVEPAINELQKSILGVTFMTIKAASAVSEAQKAETILRTPLQSQVFIFEVKDNVETGEKEAIIIRPSSLPANYVDFIWLMGDIRYFRN